MFQTDDGVGQEEEEEEEERRAESEACLMCISYYTQQSRPIIWFQVDVIKGFGSQQFSLG